MPRLINGGRQRDRILTGWMAGWSPQNLKPGEELSPPRSPRTDSVEYVLRLTCADQLPGSRSGFPTAKVKVTVVQTVSGQFCPLCLVLCTWMCN